VNSFKSRLKKSDGFFILMLGISKNSPRSAPNLGAGPHQVMFSSVGFISKKVTIQLEQTQDEVLNVELKVDVKQLGDIVIVGTRADSRTVTTSPLPFDVLNFATIQSSGRSSPKTMNSKNKPISACTKLTLRRVMTRNTKSKKTN